MPGGRNCMVIGCSNCSQNSRNKHFYKVPKFEPLRSSWITFSRRGEYYGDRRLYVCEDHFHPSCFEYKKKQVLLAKGTVPTIFRRLTAEGEEIVVVTYDSAIHHYLEEGTLLNPAYDREKHEQDLVEKQARKLAELQKLCRFCAEVDHNKPLIAIDKLKKYSIRPVDVFAIIGLNTEPKIFSNEICEECFQFVVSIDGYQRRCVKAQNALILEVKHIDEELHKIRGTSGSDPDSWNMLVDAWNDNEEEEALDDDDDDDVKSISSSKKIEDVVFKTETKDEPMSDVDFDYDDWQTETIDPDYPSQDSDYEMPPVDTKLEQDNIEEEGTSKKKRGRPKKVKETDPTKKPKAVKKKVKKLKPDNDDDDIAEVTETPLPMKDPKPIPENPDFFGKDLYNPMDTSAVIINAERQHFALRIYECFFCRLKFGGKATFKAHECQVKQIHCPTDGCEKKFTSQSGFNCHIKNLHKLPVIKKLYCKCCKTVFCFTAEEFLEHSRKCENDSAKQVGSHSVKCSICDKECNNIQSLTVHMMYHTEGDDNRFIARGRGKLKSNKPRKVMPVNKQICEDCGKDFATAKNLIEHQRRLHRPTTAQWNCDFCGKSKKSKEILRKHIRNVHTNKPTACKVCGKVFRNISLVQAHMLYHKEEKRIHFCPMCPDKPPWWTAVALKRHQEANHGFGPGFQCDICDSNYKSKTGLTTHKTQAHGIGQARIQRPILHHSFTNQTFSMT